MIKTVIFDLSEVLLHGLLGVEDYLNQIYGLKVENSQWKIAEMDKFFHGEITENMYWQAVIGKYGWTITVEQLYDAVRTNFYEIEGTRLVIEELKHNGYALGLLSVHSREWIEYCEREFGYHKLFDSVMYSYEVAVSKPSKKAFELITEKMNVKAEECLFVDDSAVNIQSAKDLGMHVIQFIDAAQLRSELVELRLLSKSING